MLFMLFPRETPAIVFFIDSLLSSTHDTVRELHHLISLLLDSVCQAMTHSLDKSVPAEITARLQEVGRHIFYSSIPSVNEEFISRYKDTFYADFMQNASTSSFSIPQLSLDDLRNRLLCWKRSLASIITSSPSFDLPDPMLRSLAGALRFVTLPDMSLHSRLAVRPLAVTSFTPLLENPSYQSRHFAVATDADAGLVAGSRLHYALHEMSEERMLCSLHARVMESCLDNLLEETPLAHQHLHCSTRFLLPMGATHVLVRERPADQSLFTLVDALLRDKGQDYNEVLFASVPNYVAWNRHEDSQATVYPRSAVDFELLTQLMW